MKNAKKKKILRKKKQVAMSCSVCSYTKKLKIWSKKKQSCMFKNSNARKKNKQQQNITRNLYIHTYL